jgi:hypothetical protein
VVTSGLVAGSLNIVLYWGWVVWLQMHYTTEAWRVKERLWSISICLILIAVVGGVFGKGRVCALVCLAGILGFFLWVTTAVGFL